MREKPSKKQIFELYLRHVISEAREASEELAGSFLIGRKLQWRYIRAHILFVSSTSHLDVKAEVEEWLKIYKWIEAEKDELLHRYEVEKDTMIVLYPRFISFKEYSTLPSVEKAHLEKKRIIWYRPLESFS